MLVGTDQDQAPPVAFGRLGGRQIENVDRDRTVGGGAQDWFGVRGIGADAQDRKSASSLWRDTRR